MATKKRSTKKGLTSQQVDLLSSVLTTALRKKTVADNPAAQANDELRQALSNTFLQLFFSVARKADLEAAKAVIQNVLDGGGQGGGSDSKGAEDPEPGN